MERFCMRENKKVESTRADAFLKEFDELCKKHNLSIAHEDYSGGFILEEYKEGNIIWLNSAAMDITN